MTIQRAADTAAEGMRRAERPDESAPEHPRNVLSSHAAPLLSGPEGSSLPLRRYAQTPVDVPHTEIVAPGSSSHVAGKTLDASKSPSELARAGAIQDHTAGQRAEAHQPGDKRKDVNAGGDSTATINVGLRDRNHPDAGKPDFLISEDGKIKMLRDPERGGSPNVNVILERKDGQLNPTEQQKAAADALVRYLSDRMSGKNPSGAGAILNDRDDVISDAQRGAHTRPPQAEQDIAPETRQAIHQAHRFHGTRGVDMPHASTADIGAFGTRDVPRQPGESDKTAAMKEAWAGLFNPDRQAVYDTIRKQDDGYHVGRYGFTGKQLHAFLDSLGHPPDPAKIDQLIKDGKLPKDFAEQLKNPQFLKEFEQFVNKLESGQGAVDKQELAKFLPKEAQEAVATMMVGSMQARVGDSAGKVAAGLLSGKAPDQVSNDDLQSPKGQQLQHAGEALYNAATNRQASEANDRAPGKPAAGDRAGLIQKALELAGATVSGANMAAVNAIVQHESSWNPHATNNWDSNARRGTPSKGLMQTIGPTFERFHLPGMNDIYNPLHNLVAGIRYSMHRYGSLENVPGVRSLTHGGGYKPY